MHTQGTYYLKGDGRDEIMEGWKFNAKNTMSEIYCTTCVKWKLSKRPKKIGFQD